MCDGVGLERRGQYDQEHAELPYAAAASHRQRPAEDLRIECDEGVTTVSIIRGERDGALPCARQDGEGGRIKRERTYRPALDGTLAYPRFPADRTGMVLRSDAATALATV